jgi:hypothetical protein
MNQYDEMKKMLNNTRKGVVWRRLHEDTKTYYNQEKESNRSITDQELEDEKSEFASNVTKLTEFNDFKINYDNVTWSGFMPKEKIEWVYSLESDEGIYISCELTQLTQGNLELIQKLYGYYVKWSDKWSGEIGVKGSETQQPGQESSLPPPTGM